VDGLVGWIGTLPSLDARAPSEITIHGLHGAWLDVGVSPSWKSSCPDETQPIAVFLTEAGSAGDTFAIVGSARVRLIFLDLGAGDILMVNIVSADPADSHECRR
jgi:hypothetical protein